MVIYTSYRNTSYRRYRYRSTRYCVCIIYGIKGTMESPQAQAAIQSRGLAEPQTCPVRTLGNHTDCHHRRIHADCESVYITPWAPHEEPRATLRVRNSSQLHSCRRRRRPHRHPKNVPRRKTPLTAATLVVSSQSSIAWRACQN